MTKDQGPRRRLSLVLWVALVIVVWNVVFDRVLIYAGRDYVKVAQAAAEGSGPYARIDDYMRPARSRALALASLAAGVVLAAGVMMLRRPGPAGRPTSIGSPRRT